jgi:hypothetical protein
MAAMQHLRQAKHLIRLVLAAFALVLGVAVASPLVKPQSFALICGSGGVLQSSANGFGWGNTAPTVADDGASDTASAAVQHLLDCPLCLPLLHAAVLSRQGALCSPSPLSIHALVPCGQAVTQQRHASPAQARAPPLSL